MDRPPSAEEIASDRQKAKTYSALVGIVQAHRSNKNYSQETLELTGQILKKNPDSYSLWNYRREILISLYSSIGLGLAKPSTKISRDVGAEIIDMELSLSAAAITKNPKSYCGWYHRVWVLERLDVDIASELVLCNKFLTADQRNFHCWNYRRHLVSVGNISPKAEFEYSTEKICENFSNYSAFHHRSVYIKDLFANEVLGDLNNVFEEEFSIIENAVFTEPDDQSAWWYYHFLVKFVRDRCLDEMSLYNTLSHQLEVMQGLLEVEESSKWAMMTIIFLIDVMESLNVQGHDREEKMHQRQRMLDNLCEIDPTHRCSYMYRLGRNN